MEANRKILQRATILRSALKGLATLYRKPSQAADIYVMIGLLSGICAYASLDLDHPDEAMAQARASFIMGDLADHDALRAWALGTRSLIARFQNNYAEALGYAREGLQYATSGTALVRLRCGEGQTLAHMGDAAGAVPIALCGLAAIDGRKIGVGYRCHVVGSSGGLGRPLWCIIPNHAQDANN